MASGAAWMVVARLATRGIGVISTLILARVLMPEDFGLVAMATALVALIELLRAFGFDTALIQNQQAGRDHYDTAWTFNALFGVAAAGVVCLLAWPASVFYSESRVVLVMWVLAAGIALQGFENVGVVDFRKHLQFNREFTFTIGAKIAAFVSTVTAALWLRNYWALVVGVLAGRVWALGASFWMHPYRPRFSLAARRELLGFSKWLLLNNFLLFLKSRASDFVIGRIAGARSLGLFNISDEISNLPTTEIVMPINRAVYAGYAQIANDRARLRTGFLNVISVIAAFAVPAGAGIAVTAPLLVPLLLGSQWLDAIPLIQVLAPYGVLIALQTNTLYVYIALGEPRTATLLNALHVALLVPTLVLLTTHAGAMGAAWGCLLVTIVTTPVNIVVLVRRLQVSPRDLLAAAWRPLAAASAMLAVVHLVVSWSGTSPAGSAGVPWLAAQLGLAVFVGAAAYTVVVWLLWLACRRPPGIEKELIGRLASARFLRR
jgi:O-antigen/teichoic acid export membrane protein